MPVDELQDVKYVPIELPGFGSYRAGSDGSVWGKGPNTRNTEQDGEWHRIIGSKDKDGYWKLAFYAKGQRLYARVNILILTAFSGPPPEGMKNPTAAHNNGIKDDNRLTNLRWATQKDNIADKRLHGTDQKGERAGNAILTEAQVIEIRKRWRDGERGQTSMGKEYGVSAPTICAVITRRIWKHVA